MTPPRNLTGRPVRIVMMADNPVVGDSRVIKAARTAQAVGYDVVVLGTDSRRRDLMIGGVPALLRPSVARTARRGLARRVIGVAGFGDVNGLRVAQAREAGRRAAAKQRIVEMKQAAQHGPLVRRMTRTASAEGSVMANVLRRQVFRVRAKASRVAQKGRPPYGFAAALEKRLPQVAGRASAWRHLDPLPQRLSDGWQDELVRLRPDLIHAHDYRTLPASIEAKKVARWGGRDVKVVYDAHEWVPGYVELGQARHEAAQRIERSLIRQVDSVVTVADRIAEMIRDRYDLPHTPPVVLNAPEDAAAPTPGPRLRHRVHVDPDVPLMVYAGSVGKGRSLGMCVEALALLPDVHLALVVGRPDSNVMVELTARAEELGVRDRLHITRYVDQENVVDFLRDATLGLIPMRRDTNTENSVPTKAREYLLAGVPQVVSDVATLSAFVLDHGLGEVFVADDVESFAAAARRVLSDPAKYRASITPGLRAENSWTAQEPVLLAVYRRLLRVAEVKAAKARIRANPPPMPPQKRALEPVLGHADGRVPSRLVIGPTNSAGQAWAWSRAAEAHLDGVSAVNIAIDHDSAFTFPATYTVKTAERTDHGWLDTFEVEVIGARTHVLLESGCTLAGSAIDPMAVGAQVARFEASGLTVGVVLHGSEVRDPRRHAVQFPWSNFHEADSAWLATLQKRVDTTLPLVAWLGLPTFVSTLDLLDYVPWAMWLPVTVDLAAYANASAPLIGDIPVVLHVPSKSILKGSHAIDPVLEDLASAGIIEYRRLADIPARDMPAHIREADIVVDQVGLGLYGAFAVESMAAGRVVLGQVGSRIRDRVPDPVPIVEVSAVTLKKVILDVLSDRGHYRATAEQGRTFVTTYHSGRAAAEALAPFLGRRMREGV